MLFYSSSFAEGLSGWLNINYTNTEQFEEGKKTSKSDSLFENYYLRLDKSITPALSYQLYLRTTLTNSHSTDAEGNTTTTYLRAAEPALDITLRNPMYGLTAGYRRLEQWSTAHFTNDSRRTTEFYYSRFDLTPYEFPSLSLQFDRQSDFDHLSVRQTDTTNTRYAGSSMYTLTYKELNLSYNVTYTHNINETPIGLISKTITDTLNGAYNLGYNKTFWGGKANVSAGYQGTYGRNKSVQNATQTGSQSFKRTPSLGQYGLGTQAQPNVDTLAASPTLTDVVAGSNTGYITPSQSGAINIGQNGNKFHNIGIQLFSSEKPVDTLIIYVLNVSKNVTSDTKLTNPGNWKVFRSDFNLPFTWTEITIQNVTLSPFVDPFNNPDNNIFRYEIKFSKQNALFFRAINMDTASINDVLVTEIEAIGTDVIPQSGKITDITTFFTQGFNFAATLRPVSKLSFTLNYFINRTDQDPKSVLDSVGGIFKNILSKSLPDQEEKLRSNVTRAYGASSTWLTHRLLTTTLRFQRNEAFDNKNEVDISTNTYSLDFSSSPIPTLDTHLSLIRTISFSFDKKQSTNNLYLLTIGSKLFRDVNMITDIGYTQTKTFAIDTLSSASESNTGSIRGTLDARLTAKLYGNLTYGFSRTTGTTSSTSKDGGLLLTYRPGQFINLTGSFKFSDTDGNRIITEGFLIDWMPVPAIRLNLNYQHSNTEPGPIISDLISSYAIWYITKFLDLQLTYSLTLNSNDKKTEIHTIAGNLTCRFW